MKKLGTTLFAGFMTIASQAQVQTAPENFDPFKSRDFLFDALHISTVIIVIYLVSSFLLQLFRTGMNQRIKNRILDKGTDENIVRELLKPEVKDPKNAVLQWFFILLSIGIGLLLIKLIGPIGLHSLAILAFSMAAGFGGYYYFTRQKTNI